jgi:hypothetical protein
MTCINGHEMGPESNICSECGAKRVDRTPIEEMRSRKWLIPTIAGVTIAALALVFTLLFVGGSPTGAKTAKIVDQIPDTSCASAASTLNAHRGSIVVVQGAGRKALSLGKVASVWEGTGKDSKPACNLLLEAQIPPGQKSYRIVVGSATPLIVSGALLTTAIAGTAWMYWSGRSWVSIQ